MPTSLSGRRDRVLAAALVLVLGLALVGFLWLGTDVPADYDCGEEEPAGNDLDGFRAGGRPAHALVTFALLGAICALSWRRDGRRHVGQPTAVAVTLAVLLTVIAVFNEDVAVWIMILAFFSSGIGYGLLIGAGCLLAGALIRGRAGYWFTMAGLWHAVLGGVPFHALVFYSQGAGPFLC